MGCVWTDPLLVIRLCAERVWAYTVWVDLNNSALT